MIHVTKYNGLYSLCVNARKVSIIDRFRISQYSSYLGKHPVWGMKRDIKNTILIDLSRTKDDILSSFKSNTRNEVRKAQTRGIQSREITDIKAFIEFYNEFAREKNLSSISALDLKKYNKVLIYEAYLDEGKPLVMHASLIDESEKRALLLFSASVRLAEGIDRKVVGLANRLLHFDEFVTFSEMGLSIYDFSGVCNDPNDPRYTIGLFKKSFGGQEIESIYLKSFLFVLISKFITHKE